MALLDIPPDRGTDGGDTVEIVNTQDFVPVVRCRNCVYGCLSKNGSGEDMVFCENPDLDEAMDIFVNEPDWYCADGERRDSE